jgi:hypothetical protein
MGLLDKVKAVAKDVAVEAKKGTATLQGKLETGQLRKKADEAAKQLGYLIARERSEGAAAGEDADRLVGEIVAIEAQIKSEQDDTEAKIQAATSAPGGGPAPATATGDAPVPEQPGTPAQAGPPASASQPVEGDFKLD